jgi:hypothetical protein
VLVAWFGCAASEGQTTTGDVPGKRSAEAAAAPAASPRGPAVDETPPEKAVERGTVRLITLPAPKPNLPPGAGRETVMVLCGTCHTPEYITLQPQLSRETWTAVVTKMRTTYSGPIPEDKLDEVMNYLVAVRGLPKK